MALLVKNKRLVVKNGRLQLAGGCCCDTAVACLLSVNTSCAPFYTSSGLPRRTCRGDPDGAVPGVVCCRPVLGSVSQGYYFLSGRWSGMSLVDNTAVVGGSGRRKETTYSGEWFEYVELGTQLGVQCSAINPTRRGLFTLRAESVETRPQAPFVTRVTVNVAVVDPPGRPPNVGCGDPGVECARYEDGVLIRTDQSPVGLSIGTGTGISGPINNIGPQDSCSGSESFTDGDYFEREWSNSYDLGCNSERYAQSNRTKTVETNGIIRENGISLAWQSDSDCRRTAAEPDHDTTEQNYGDLLPGPSYATTRCTNGDPGPRINAALADAAADVGNTAAPVNACCYAVDFDSLADEPGYDIVPDADGCGRCGTGVYSTVACCTGEAGPDLPTIYADNMADGGFGAFAYEGACYEVDRSVRRLGPLEFDDARLVVLYADCVACLEALGLPVPDDCPPIGGGGGGDGIGPETEEPPTGIGPDRPIGPPIGPGDLARRGTGAFL